jgi:ferredoxin
MQILIDRPKCCGAGQCVLAAPDVFDQDVDGVACLLSEDVDPAQFDDVREAAANCPTSAITLNDG